MARAQAPCPYLGNSMQPLSEKAELMAAQETLADSLAHRRLAAARQRMERAKASWTGAAQAAMRGDPGASDLASAALLELDAAREALRQLNV